MAIRYRCEHCGELLSIASRMAGREIPCPICGRLGEIPAADEAAAPAADSPLASPGIPLPEPAAPGSAIAPSAAVPLPAGGSGRPAQAALPAPTPPEQPSQPEAIGHALAFRTRPIDMEEMDLTSMVDLTFLLLIFFMVTASFLIQKSIEHPAPTPDQQGATQTLFTPEELEQTSVRVRVDEKNAIFVEDEPVRDQSRLVDALRGQMRTSGRNELILTADEAAYHETVVAVIDAANAAGVQRIRLAGRE